MRLVMGGMAPEKGKDGQFKTSLSLEDVLSVFDTVEGPVITSSDITEEFDCSGDTARLKLRKLSEQGRIDGRKIARRTVWWRTEE